MWIMKLTLVVLIFEVFAVLAVPRRHGTTTTKVPLGGLGAHGGTSSHGIESGLGTGINLVGTGSNIPTKPNLNGNTDADRNADCKLVFNIEMTSDGKPTVTSIKMPQLTRMLNAEGTGMTRDNICNLIFAVNPTINLNNLNKETNPIRPGYLPTMPTMPTMPVMPTVIVNKDEDVRSAHSLHKDIEQVIDTLQPQEQHSIYYPEWSTQNFPNIQPVYEVYPEVIFDDSDSDNDEQHNAWPTFSTPTVSPDENNIQVVENFNVVHLNGTSEHKLVLSNGMVNYKKIYKKVVDGKEVTVQEGYDSVPIPGTHNTQFNTQYYIADERGHNVYRVEQNDHRPELPHFLSFRDQISNAKKTGKL